MTLNILVLENSHTAPAGFVGEELTNLGAQITVLNLLQTTDNVSNSELDLYQGLVVLGGPMGAYDDERYPQMSEVLDIIKWFHRQQRPIFAICLGAQLLARALDQPYKTNNGWELGFTKLTYTEAGKIDPMFQGLGEETMVFELHQDSFELPEGSTLLMVGEQCTNQAYRVGRSAYGVQFHPEVTRESILLWTGLFADEHPQEDALISRLTVNLNAYFPGSERYVRTITRRWLDMCATDQN